MKKSELSESFKNNTKLYISQIPKLFISYFDLFLAYKKDINEIEKREYLAHNSNKKYFSIIITFKTHLKAKEVREKLNMIMLNGKILNIMWYDPDFDYESNKEFNLYIKGIQNLTPRNVYELFIPFGEIKSSIVRLDENGNNLGYGYISYYEPTSCEKVISSLNKKKLM